MIRTSYLWAMDACLCAEGLMFCFSLAATILHFRAAGVISQLTLFHVGSSEKACSFIIIAISASIALPTIIPALCNCSTPFLQRIKIAHLSLCAYFCGWEMPQIISRQRFPTCDSYLWAVRSVPMEGMYVVTWLIFTEFWENVLCPASKRFRPVRAALCIFSVAVLFYGSIEYYPRVMCAHEDKTKSMMYIISRLPFGISLFFDSGRLARACYRRVAETPLLSHRDRRSFLIARPVLAILSKTWHLSGICISEFFFLACLVSWLTLVLLEAPVPQYMAIIAYFFSFIVSVNLHRFIRPFIHRIEFFMLS